MVREAQLEQTPAGLVPKGEGWFVVNAKEAYAPYGRPVEAPYRGQLDGAS